LEFTEAQLDRYQSQFGWRHDGRVRIFLFFDEHQVAKIFGPNYAGTILFLANAIVVTWGGDVHELVKHELAHLFASHWNSAAPPLLSEGLAVWMQETKSGRPIDWCARQLFGKHAHNLSQLLNQRFFFSQPQIHACYLLAGSFTGFLIQRFGWNTYKRFYRRQLHHLAFRMRFRKCFGVGLEEAELQWRKELLAFARPKLDSQYGNFNRKKGKWNRG
jgi:hypothetical protein